jgi:hypothetical protein
MAEDSTALTGTRAEDSPTRRCQATSEPKYDFVEGALIGAIVFGMLIAAVVLIDLL